MRKENAYYGMLLSRFIDNELSQEEVSELFDFIQENPARYDHLLNTTEIKDKLNGQAFNHSIHIDESISSRMRERLLAAVDDKGKLINHSKQVRFFNSRKWLSYAAAVIFVVAIGAVTIRQALDYNTNKTQNKIALESSAVNDVLPGRDGAILTLASGQKILLDSLGNGVVTKQGKTTLIIRNGQLIYDGIAKEDEMLHNTMTTPKGRQYRLELPDGSRVWLNAASSINYPVSFPGGDRTVTITGEAYFEVAKDKSKPFRVRVNGMMVEVLGTHFNINSYAEEGDIKTTLLEGRVRISNNEQTNTLLPGQQAIAEGQQIRLVSNADIEQVMAWRNGKFHFDRTPFAVVMRQLCRWYDMEAEYAGAVPDVVFSGSMGRDLNLSQVLKVLSKMEVRFKIEGKKIVVLP